MKPEWDKTGRIDYVDVEEDDNAANMVDAHDVAEIPGSILIHNTARPVWHDFILGIRYACEHPGPITIIEDLRSRNNAEIYIIPKAWDDIMQMADTLSPRDD